MITCVFSYFQIRTAENHQIARNVSVTVVNEAVAQVLGTISMFAERAAKDAK